VIWSSVRSYGLVSDCIFSVRRGRHTISKRDWSSDVCSSDLFHPYTESGRYRSIHTPHPRSLPEEKIMSNHPPPVRWVVRLSPLFPLQKFLHAVCCFFKILHACRK